MTKIDQKIVGYSVVTNNPMGGIVGVSAVPPDTMGGIVGVSAVPPDTMVCSTPATPNFEGMFSNCTRLSVALPPKPRLLERPEVLSSKTYRLKTPLSEHALYITISDIETPTGTRPFEIFINCKSMENFQWIVALTRIASAIFRTETPPDLLVQELKEVFDPRGGYWKKGHLVPSLVAEIGMIIERHIKPTEQKEPEAKPEEPIPQEFPVRATLCPSCGAKAVIKLDGCATCVQCGYGKCD